MTVFPLFESKDPQAKIAMERLLQIKSQLNLSSSLMSRQAPKDITREREACEFNIKELSNFWAGGEKRFDDLVVFITKRPVRNMVNFFFM